MAKVRFVFGEGTEALITAATDRGAKLLVSGFRRKMEAGDTFIEVKGVGGSTYVNADAVCFVDFQGLTPGGGGKKKPAGKGKAPAKKSAPKKKGRR